MGYLILSIIDDEYLKEMACPVDILLYVDIGTHVHNVMQTIYDYSRRERRVNEGRFTVQWMRSGDIRGM